MPKMGKDVCCHAGTWMADNYKERRQHKALGDELTVPEGWHLPRHPHGLVSVTTLSLGNAMRALPPKQSLRARATSPSHVIFSVWGTRVRFPQLSGGHAKKKTWHGLETTFLRPVEHDFSNLPMCPLLNNSVRTSKWRKTNATLVKLTSCSQNIDSVEMTLSAESGTRHSPYFGTGKWFEFGEGGSHDISRGMTGDSVSSLGRGDDSTPVRVNTTALPAVAANDYKACGRSEDNTTILSRGPRHSGQRVSES
ncbi:hypothetical protein Bbelb_259620 [Branchiostoma belcheri]|nr:hypothetical protein Bbelb_259620 [Branchiostoma belcheri]